MAVQPYYDGPAYIKIDANQGAGLENLGYTEDGAQTGRDRFVYNVYGDQNGGTDGPPIDIQYLGAIWRVNLTLTSWDAAVADKIAAVVAGTSAGSNPTPGTLLFTESSKVFRLLIHTTNRPLNFLRSVPVDFDINKGVKHSKLLLSWECHKNASDVFFNSTTS